MKRGDVVLVRLPHPSGQRGKKRPAAVVQSDAYAGAVSKACDIRIVGDRAVPRPGSEWFLTSPTEVLELVRFFDPELAKNEA